MRRLLPALAFAFLLPAAVQAHESGSSSTVTLVFEQPLPNVPGMSLKVVLVDYPPGGGSAAHRHPSRAFIYARVLEGAVRSQVNGGPATVYRAGESFVEMPGDRHDVSENASDSEPSRLLAVFVVPTGDTELVLPYED